METTAAVEGKNLTDELRWSVLQRKTQEVRAREAFEMFREAGIEPILIKGLAAARFYPESKARMSVDMDIAVAAKDFEAGERIAIAAASRGLAIDLHRELRDLDTVAWDDLFANSQLIDVDGGTIRVLRPEDHLRVLIVHWLTNGGSDRDRLWDVYYAIENRLVDFDWDRFLNVVTPDRRRWFVCTIGLAHKFLGLDLAGTPIAEEAARLPEWLPKAVEKAWASDSRLFPLHIVAHEPGKFIDQVRLRLRPDPIAATVQMEGSFDARTRVFYQVGNFFRRIVPSFSRVSATLKK